MFVRPLVQRREVDALARAGHNDSEIARVTGVPRSTVRDWRRGAVKFRDTTRRICGACGAEEHDHERLPAAAYGYLLGQYLGDGHVATWGHKTPCLRVSMDLLHMNLAERCRGAILDVLPGARVAFDTPPSSRVLIVRCYSRQWPCLLPQCGPGAKHDRAIVLTGWQRRLVAQCPEELVCGLLHSDGWRGVNRVTANGKSYAYPRYQFSQVSTDIQRIFTDALDVLGVAWRQMGPRNVSVAQRASVARLDEFVGRKG